jgi:serine phosphatase RsbU (regulator of sigma subunit)
MSSTTQHNGQSRDSHEGILVRSLLRKDVALNGPAWLPLALVLVALGAVGYADHLVLSISLVYLYIFPVAVGAIFLRKGVNYGFIVLCVLFHDYYSPRGINPGLRVFHNLSATLCFAFVVYVIHRYIEQREALARTVERQRDELVKDVELAAQVQRLFLPSGERTISGLEIAGLMQPVRGAGGDYYDYFPIGAHTTQIVIADVAGKGVSAALLMSATAGVMRLEASQDRNMLEQVERLNTEIHSVSDSDRFVTLLVAQLNTQKQTLQYVNCGHNPALLFRAETGAIALMESSCQPIGLSPEEVCEQAVEDLVAGDILVFYTDGVTEAKNRLGEQFGLEQLSAAVRLGSSLSPDEIMAKIYNAAADFCGDDFDDDVTILVVKCNFDGSATVSS